VRLGYGRGGPYVSMGCLGWLLLLIVVVAAGGALIEAIR
jgi:hypothetical protein